MLQRAYFLDMRLLSYLVATVHHCSKNIEAVFVCKYVEAVLCASMLKCVCVQVC